MKLKRMMSMKIFAKIKASLILIDIQKNQNFMTTTTTTTKQKQTKKKQQKE